MCFYVPHTIITLKTLIGYGSGMYVFSSVGFRQWHGDTLLASLAVDIESLTLKLAESSGDQAADYSNRGIITQQLLFVGLLIWLRHNAQSELISRGCIT